MFGWFRRLFKKNSYNIAIDPAIGKDKSVQLTLDEFYNYDPESIFDWE